MTWTANLAKRRRRHVVLLILFTVFSGYVLFVAAAWAADVNATNRMNRFDLDGDGDISGAELTPDAQSAIDRWANDTGRTMAPILGLPLTGIWTTIVFLVLYSGEWIVIGLFGNRTNSRSPSPEVADITTNPRGNISEDGNPYRSPSDRE